MPLPLVIFSAVAAAGVVAVNGALSAQTDRLDKQTYYPADQKNSFLFDSLDYKLGLPVFLALSSIHTGHPILKLGASILITHKAKQAYEQYKRKAELKKQVRKELDKIFKS